MVRKNLSRSQAQLCTTQTPSIARNDRIPVGGSWSYSSLPFPLPPLFILCRVSCVQALLCVFRGSRGHARAWVCACVQVLMWLEWSLCSICFVIVRCECCAVQACTGKHKCEVFSVIVHMHTAYYYLCARMFDWLLHSHWRILTLCHTRPHTRTLSGFAVSQTLGLNRWL